MPLNIDPAQPSPDFIAAAHAHLASLTPQRRSDAVAGILMGCIDVLAAPNSAGEVPLAFATARAYWQAFQDLSTNGGTPGAKR